MLRNVLCIAGAVILACAARADDAFRVFDAQGRMVEAKVLHVDFQRGTVELELRGGQKKKVKPSIFSKEDQQYIMDFGAIQEFRSSRLKVELEKKTLDKRREMLGSQSAIRRDTDVLCYEVKVLNRTAVRFDDLEVQYNIFYEQEELTPGASIAKDLSSKGSEKLVLDKQKSKVFQTGPYEVYNQRLAGGYDGYVGGAPTNQSGKSKGIWLKLYLKTKSGQTAVKDVANPKTAISQYTWQSP